MDKRTMELIGEIDMDPSVLWQQIHAIRSNGSTVNKSEQGTGKSISAYIQGRGGTVYVAPDHAFIQRNLVEKTWNDLDMNQIPNNHIRGFENYMKWREWGDMSPEARRDAERKYYSGYKPRLICEYIENRYGEYDVIKGYREQFPDDWSEERTALVRHSIEQIDGSEVEEIIVEENIQDTVKTMKLNVTDFATFNNHLRSIKKSKIGSAGLSAETANDIRKAYDCLMEFANAQHESSTDVSESEYIGHDCRERYIDPVEASPDVRTVFHNFIKHLPMLVGRKGKQRCTMEKIIMDAIEDEKWERANAAISIHSIIETMEEMIHYGFYTVHSREGVEVEVRRPYMFDLLDIASDHDVDLHFRYAEFDNDVFDALIKRWWDMEQWWRVLNLDAKQGVNFEYDVINIQRQGDPTVEVIRAVPPYSNGTESFTKGEIREGEYSNQTKKTQKIFDSIVDTGILFDQVGVIGHKVFEIMLPDHVPSLHYHSLMGRNDLKDVDCLHIGGKPNLPPKEMARKYHMVFGTYPEMTDEMNPSLAGHRTKNGSLVGYDDDDLDTLYKAQVKRKVRDAVGRMRNRYDDRGYRAIIYWGSPIDIIDFDTVIEGDSHNRPDENLLKHLCEHGFDISRADFRVAQRIDEYLMDTATDDGRNPRGYDTASIKEYVKGDTSTIVEMLNTFFTYHKDGYTKLWEPQ